MNVSLVKNDVAKTPDFNLVGKEILDEKGVYTSADGTVVIVNNFRQTILIHPEGQVVWNDTNHYTKHYRKLPKGHTVALEFTS